jgi:hypothetical protein
MQILEEQLNKIKMVPKPKPRQKPVKPPLITIKSFDPGFDSI